MSHFLKHTLLSRSTLFAPCALFLLSLLICCPQAQAEPQRAWRAIYVEGGPHPTYSQTLGSLARALKAEGLIPRADFPADLEENSVALWQWLNKNATGGLIEFPADGLYSSAWNAETRQANKTSLLRRIKEDGDVDLILALGTAAGYDMATDEHSVPTFVLTVTDPLGAGLTRTENDSGRDNVYVQVLPRREQRKLNFFHNMFGFSRLGVMYEDTPEGRAFCGLSGIEEAAEDTGFELVRCKLDPAALDKPEQMRICVNRLASEADAAYLTFAVARQGLPLEEIIAPLRRAKIPTFSQAGVEDTRRGVLMSFSMQSYDETAGVVAHAMHQVMQGALPRSLPQVANPHMGLAINLRMAMLIDWDLPQEALVAVDELCDQVSSCEAPAAEAAVQSVRSRDSSRW